MSQKRNEKYFIKAGLHLIDANKIVAVSPPIWIETEVKRTRRKTKEEKKSSFGPPKSVDTMRKIRVYSFQVHLERFSIKILPCSKPLTITGNTKTNCIKEYERVMHKLKELYENEDKITSIGKVNEPCD